MPAEEPSTASIADVLEDVAVPKACAISFRASMIREACLCLHRHNISAAGQQSRQIALQRSRTISVSLGFLPRLA